MLWVHCTQHEYTCRAVRSIPNLGNSLRSALLYSTNAAPALSVILVHRTCTFAMLHPSRRCLPCIVRCKPALVSYAHALYECAVVRPPLQTADPNALASRYNSTPSSNGTPQLMQDASPSPTPYIRRRCPTTAPDHALSCHLLSYKLIFPPCVHKG